MRQTDRATSVVILLMFVSLAAFGAGRGRAVRVPPPHASIAIGAEYRIPAAPDSPWLESVAVAVGPVSGLVLWTESGSIRYARLGTDGHPIDTTGRPLLENGHYQQRVAVDAIQDHFVVAWCDVSTDKKQIVALFLDSSGRTSASAATVVADNIGSTDPNVNVTCSRAGCLVSWAGNGNFQPLPSLGAVSAEVFSTTSSPSSHVLLADKGIGNGVGSDGLNFATAYAEQVAYGRSGALVAKFITPTGTVSEVDLMSSSQNQIGSTWMAWGGTEWFILMLDLTASGELAQEFRFMRIDAAGQPVGAATGTLLESAGVPPLCPFAPDVFLYDPQNRRVVWDGTNFLVFTQRAVIPVTTEGRVLERVAANDYFPRGYALSVSSSGSGRTVAAYSRDTAVAVRAINEIP